MRVLITGGTGFIGRHCADAFEAAGHEVHTAHRSGRDGRDWRFDLLQEEHRRAILELVAPHVILTCAWGMEQDFWTDPDNEGWGNATFDLFLKAQKAGVRRFVGVGSCAEADPRTPYARAKDECRRSIERSSNGLSWAWTRVFMPIGIGEPLSKLVPSLAAKFAQGEAAEISSGKAIRDWIDVQDVGAALASVALSDVRGVVDIGTGQPVSVREIAETMARIAGRPDLLRVGARPDRDEPPWLVADIKALRDGAHFSPRFSLAHTLAASLHRAQVSATRRQSGQSL